MKCSLDQGMTKGSLRSWRMNRRAGRVVFGSSRELVAPPASHVSQHRAPYITQRSRAHFHSFAIRHFFLRCFSKYIITLHNFTLIHLFVTAYF